MGDFAALMLTHTQNHLIRPIISEQSKNLLIICLTLIHERGKIFIGGRIFIAIYVPARSCSFDKE
jgi:hypothetical protein